MTAHPDRPLRVGDVAPDFTLADQGGESVRLDLLRRDKNVVLVFFPFAFSGICTGELDGIRDHLEDFVADDLAVLTISCDPTFAQRAWADAQGYFFPLLSDFWPHGAVARSYGVFLDDLGCSSRGTFLVDRDGRVRWTLVNPAGTGRDFSGLADAVAALRAPG